MKSTRYGLVGLILASLTLSPPVLGAGGETVDRSTPASTLELSYDLYVGGIPLGKVAMSGPLPGHGLQGDFDARDVRDRQRLLAVQDRGRLQRPG